MDGWAGVVIIKLKANLSSTGTELGKNTSQILSSKKVSSNDTLFGGTVLQNSTQFGRTVLPNCTLFDRTPDSDKPCLIFLL